jgi:2-enoate reductase
MADMAAEVKKVVKIPVVAVGRLDIPELAEKVIAEGQADIVAIGRGLLADSYWAAKTAFGKTEEIRPCIGCHDGCIGRFFLGKPLSCAVNPSCGREVSFRLSQTSRPKRVSVIGGGIAGMEAARVAAIRGHDVTLYEKKGLLGGHLIEASIPDFKKDLATLLKWYENQLKNLEVEVKLGTVVSQDVISKEAPGVVIVATGSVPVVPRVRGIDGHYAITCIDLLLGQQAGQMGAVVGGYLIGCERPS